MGGIVRGHIRRERLETHRILGQEQGALGQNPVLCRIRMLILFVLLAGVLLSWVLTLAVRSYAVRSELMDRPNERSSHTVPTPRGGGLAIVVSFLLLIAAMQLIAPMQDAMLAGLCGSAALVALAGWLDDRHSLAARWRFLAHVVAAAWSVWLMGGIPPIPAFGMTFDLGRTGDVLAVLYLVWMINLFNFMDGIDGIAGIETVTVAVGAALCGWLATSNPLWSLPLLLAASAAGFLLLNYPPAKIFMGDVGSGFIGMVLGGMSLWAAQFSPGIFWSWLILTGCFVVDATTTLVRHVLRGEKFYEAHRSHAYQHASRVNGSHKAVSLGVGAINVAWLLPWAAAVAMRLVDGATAVLLAYAPLVWLAYRYEAGNRSAQAA
jgi:Fuc2NAc and GlcNAc transferase